MKKLIGFISFIFVITMMAVFLVSCVGQNADSTRFFKTEKEFNINGCTYQVVVDRNTNNMYLQDSSSIMPFFDADGNIQKYTGQYPTTSETTESQDPANTTIVPDTTTETTTTTGYTYMY